MNKLSTSYNLGASFERFKARNLAENQPANPNPLPQKEGQERAKNGLKKEVREETEIGMRLGDINN